MLSKILPEPEPSCRMCKGGVVTHTAPCPSCREDERVDGVERAKRAYVNGDVDIHEFEEWVAAALRGDTHKYDAVDPATGGARMLSTGPVFEGQTMSR